VASIRLWPNLQQTRGEWKNEYRSPMHKYLNVQGSFLRAGVSLPDNKPPLSFHRYNVDGKITNEEVRQLD
jgi:hypothetical protein